MPACEGSCVIIKTTGLSVDWDWDADEMTAADRKKLGDEFMAEDTKRIQYGCDGEGCQCDISKVRPHTHHSDEFHVRKVTLPNGRTTIVTAWVHCSYESWHGECKPAG